MTDTTNRPKNFAIIGAAGYIAPRHMQAIRDTGHRIVAALDKSDSVGILDRYAYDIAFFTEFERFDRFAEKLIHEGSDRQFDYVSICSPNYLHDAHIRFALRVGADAICEKPLVLNPWNLDALAEIEKNLQRHIYTILQLRLHPSIAGLKKKVEQEKKPGKYDISLQYITSRGNWYHHSWKGDIAKSGGVATNIGIHFFDMLLWIFGSCHEFAVLESTPTKMAGHLELEKARVKWLLSIDYDDLPVQVRSQQKTTYRSLLIDGHEIEFSEGFTDLHTVSYREILAGRGFSIDDSRAAIQLVYELRNAKPERP